MAKYYLFKNIIGLFMLFINILDLINFLKKRFLNNNKKANNYYIY